MECRPPRFGRRTYTLKRGAPVKIGGCSSVVVESITCFDALGNYIPPNSVEVSVGDENNYCRLPIGAPVNLADPVDFFIRVNPETWAKFDSAQISVRYGAESFSLEHRRATLPFIASAEWCYNAGGLATYPAVPAVGGNETIIFDSNTDFLLENPFSANGAAGIDLYACSIYTTIHPSSTRNLRLRLLATVKGVESVLSDTFAMSSAVSSATQLSTPGLTLPLVGNLDRFSLPEFTSRIRIGARSVGHTAGTQPWNTSRACVTLWLD